MQAYIYYVVRCIHNYGTFLFCFYVYPILLRALGKVCKLVIYTPCSILVIPRNMMYEVRDPIRLLHVVFCVRHIHLRIVLIGKVYIYNTITTTPFPWTIHNKHTPTQKQKKQNLTCKVRVILLTIHVDQYKIVWCVFVFCK